MSIKMAEPKIVYYKKTKKRHRNFVTDKDKQFLKKEKRWRRARLLKEKRNPTLYQHKRDTSDGIHNSHKGISGVYDYWKDADNIGYFAVDKLDQDDVTRLQKNDKDCLYLRDVVIEDSYVGKGFGRIMLNYFINKRFKRSKYKKLLLHVNPTNSVAINLYKSLGFKFNGRRDRVFPIIGMELLNGKK